MREALLRDAREISREFRRCRRKLAHAARVRIYLREIGAPSRNNRHQLSYENASQAVTPLPLCDALYDY